MKDTMIGNGCQQQKQCDFTPIQQFYQGRSLFITGATGVVGKTLLQTLLRSCPGIGTLYILMRPKRGLTVSERLDKLFASELFEKAKEQVPDLKEKVHIVYGNLEHDKFGISESDMEKLKRDVHIVVHAAASVQFNDPLRRSIEHNLFGTQQMLDIVRQLPKLELLIHVSTFFANRDPETFIVPEHVVKTKVHPNQLLNCLEWMSDKNLDLLTPDLLSEHMNTYQFSKALAENLIVEGKGNLPIAIVRPSLVGPTMKEPIPGFSDTIQGPQGMFIAGAKGFLRTMFSYKGFKLNIIPSDVVANTIIGTAWYYISQRQQDLFIVNCAMDYYKLPVAGEELLGEVLKKREKYPLANMYRYPDFTVHYNYPMYKIHAFLEQDLPAAVGDVLLYLFTGKPIMRKLYERINFLSYQFLLVARDPWISCTTNYKAIMSAMSDKDNQTFSMATDDIDWSQYIDDCMWTGRKVLAHEDPSTVPYAKKKAIIWYYVTTFLKWCLILYLLSLLFSRMSSNSTFLGYTDGPTIPETITELETNF